MLEFIAIFAFMLVLGWVIWLLTGIYDNGKKLLALAEWQAMQRFNEARTEGYQVESMPRFLKKKYDRLQARRKR